MRTFPANAMEPRCSPLLKWAGGKRSLLDRILPLAPQRYRRYIEPFAGGAAVFFALSPESATLSDTNEELINCYVQVRNNPALLIKKLKAFHNTEKHYYYVRSQKPRTDLNRAARFMFLTRFSFNGIYRQNLEGLFNVPYGFKTHLLPCDESSILAASSALQRVKLMCCDFEQTLEIAGKGDLVYLDPPYTVAHGNNGFVKYNAKIFSWPDQIRLSIAARSLVESGCTVLISNADHPSIRQLYDKTKFHTLTVERSSVIAASSAHRKTITECIFVGGV